MTDLHAALRTETMATCDSAGVAFVLARLQHNRDSVTYSLHARPTSFTTAGIQTTDFLAQLGFQRIPYCGFMAGQECYARTVNVPFELDHFGAAFATSFAAMQEADRHLAKCGLVPVRTEGLGFFQGRPSSGDIFKRERTVGDGHTYPTSNTLKTGEDDQFMYAFTWIVGGDDKGWITHVRPKHPPISDEMTAAFTYLHLRAFDTCPQFDFEPCTWHFMPYEPHANTPLGGNAEIAHRWFDNHPQHFSPAIEQLLAAHVAVEPFGFTILPKAVPRMPTITPDSEKLKQQGSIIRDPKYEFDVALSFAGTERELAEQLANSVRNAGFNVFYDNFYAEQLWGKELPVYFDEIYRKKARFCLIFMSPEYAERIWTNHERRSAQARALKEKGQDYILPIMVEQVELPGMPPTVGYLSIKQYSIEQIAQILISKLKGSLE